MEKSVGYIDRPSGSGFHYFGHEEWQPLAPGLKTIEDIRRRIFQDSKRLNARLIPIVFEIV
jgi:hypothetical protein